MCPSFFSWGNYIWYNIYIYMYMYVCMYACMHVCMYVYIYISWDWLLICWFVVDLPLWKIWKSVGIIMPNIRKNNTCSKPPTSLVYLNHSDTNIQQPAEASPTRSIYMSTMCGKRSQCWSNYFLKYQSKVSPVMYVIYVIYGIGIMYNYVYIYI